jgi:molecular chaperone GrpE (heat shock protein)
LRLDTRRSVLSEASESLATVRRELLNLKTTLAAAELTDDLEEAQRLTPQIVKVEKKLRKKERKVARKRAKVEKMKERIEKEKMERKKVSGLSTHL